MRHSRAIAVVLLALGCGTLSARSEKAPQNFTPLESRTGAELLALIRANTNVIRVDEPSTSQRNAFHESKDGMKPIMQGCNGQRRDLSGSELATEGSLSCQDLALRYANVGSEEEVMKALILGCWWDSQANSTHWNCRLLAKELLSHGNTEAAKAILSQADGCHSFMVGNAMNACFGFALENKQIFSAEELKAMAHDAYSREQDLGAARYLQSIGVDADAEAAQARLHQIQTDQMQVANEQQEANREAANTPNQAQQQADARLAALNQIRDQVTANGGLIQQTANQQEANIRAIADANAQRQQQQAIAAQQAAQQRAAQQAAAQQQAQQQATQNTNPSGNSSGSSGGASSGPSGSSTGSYVTPIDTGCIAEFWNPAYYNWLSFRNNCGQPVHLTFIANNLNDHFGIASMDIAVGQFQNTGWSQSEVAGKQNFALYVCASGYVPVDSATHQAISSPGESYVCEKW